jgi:anti-anti-sigma regulatory factor
MAMLSEITDALARLDDVGGELVVDLSTVRRIDASGVQGLAELAGKARDKSVKVVLRGVSAEVYKVLKLLKMETQFCLLT